ncbi:undecaprenyl/decaprenyl-phosphate alpha-N-acetylglucosaminyl 1-phosphate transferase [Carnobacterium sp. CS13]|nr:undecaprenyl/decaprenyl-phosphate alpha-N-acetylglucosaminyl 1-phosphate transferase [Carnobacterium sp. CS13]
MYDMFLVIVTCVVTAILSLALTPLIRKFAFKIGATDKPDTRRINLKEIPTLGGLGVYLSFFFALFFLLPIPIRQILPIFLGATIVIITGIIDDIKELSPKMKMVGITLAALVIYFVADIQMDRVSLPVIGSISLGWLSLPITVIWILAITNAVNLIDGLDGLATGVSMIALTTMGVIGYFFLTVEDAVVSIMIFVLVGALAGFLPYNFFPARIFLGDTGALFLGFMIAVMSLQGLKNATLITLIIPVVILGIPITDTIYAMLRRYLNKKPISSADKMHLHHQLMALGLTHRQTVLAIYCLAAIFSVIALLYPISTLWGSVFLTLGLLFGLELFVETIGLVGKDSQPLLARLRKFAKNLNKKE